MTAIEWVDVACPLCGAEESTLVATGTDYEYGTIDTECRVVRCGDCALEYLDPRPAESALEVIYPSNYYSFTGEDEGRGLVAWLRGIWEKGKAKQYARHLRPGAQRVLDLGCGSGRFLAMMRDAGPEGLELWGIDLDERAVEAARAQGFRAERSRIEDWEPGVRFDLIVMQQVIEHVADPLGVVRKLRELLAPGGVLVLETPNLAGWDYRWWRARLWGGYHFPRHWTFFTPATLRRLAEDAGLEFVEHEDLLSLSFWSWSVHHAMLVRRWPGFLVRAARPPSFPLLCLSMLLELAQSKLGKPSSNQRLVARRAPAAEGA